MGIKMKVYIVIVLNENGVTTTPWIKGVYSKKLKAEQVAYENKNQWCNIIEKELDI